MTTPIHDFLKKYAAEAPLRLHMPGHKGCDTLGLGLEALDLTEVAGADSLYEASGIIKESEDNASALFGCPTYYSTEGSSQCIRAMLYLAMIGTPSSRPLVLAARNAHKSFLSAVALLDINVEWLYGHDSTYLSCHITADDVEAALLSSPVKPIGVYLTSPDYLGNTTDIQGIAEVCHKHNVLLLVDNAHGAYLRFLSTSLHPMDLGADICCDSAHKTLPVLTGGAYLHVSEGLGHLTPVLVKQALALFGSTSPSYLIMASLDLANAYLSDGYCQKLMRFIPYALHTKRTLIQHGYDLMGHEPLKITLATKSYGYQGNEIADILEKEGLICEFADPDFLVLMLTPETTLFDLQRIQKALLSIPRRTPILTAPPQINKNAAVMTPREALLSPCEQIPVSEALGRVLGATTVGCPPAVPVLVSGEEVDKSALDAFAYYGITTVTVVRN